MNTFENIMENGAFAPKDQMLQFPLYFQILDISKASKDAIMEYRVKKCVSKIPWMCLRIYIMLSYIKEKLVIILKFGVFEQKINLLYNAYILKS